MQMEQIAAAGQLVPLVFTHDQVAASLTDAALKAIDLTWNAGTSDATLEWPGNTDVVMPFEGEVVAVTVASTAARTGGTLTVKPSVNGTAQSQPAATLDATNTQYAYARASRGQVAFKAGDRVGAAVTTDASWAPTTADIIVVVWVLVRLEEV